MKSIPRAHEYLNWQRFKLGLLIGMAPALSLTPQLSLAQGPVLEEVTEYR